MTTMIRPGLLVALKSTVRGGVSYQRTDIAKDEKTAKWETTRVIEDPAEHERATKARSKALAEIRAVCAPTTFGLLCPEENETELDAAIARAQAIRDEHNASATFTHVDIYVLKGRIASTDEEAARAIGQEVASLVDSMSQGIDRLDAAAIREAANKAKQMASMLSAEKAEAVDSAIEQARKAARQIVKRIEKDGEQAAIVLADIQRGSIQKARIAFLDLSQDEVRQAPAMPSVDVQRFAELESDDDEHGMNAIRTNPEVQ